MVVALAVWSERGVSAADFPPDDVKQRPDRRAHFGGAVPLDDSVGFDAGLGHCVEIVLMIHAKVVRLRIHVIILQS